MCVCLCEVSYLCLFCVCVVFLPLVSVSVPAVSCMPVMGEPVLCCCCCRFSCSLGFYCPTNSNQPTFCCAGFYCPTPTEMDPCPEHNYCPGASIAPKPCLRADSCPAGSTKIKRDSVVILFLAMFLVLGLAFRFKAFRARVQYELLSQRLAALGEGGADAATAAAAAAAAAAAPAAAAPARSPASAAADQIELRVEGLSLVLPCACACVCACVSILSPRQGLRTRAKRTTGKQVV
jgi:hypothetical protein